MSLIIEFIRDIFLYIYKMFKFTARKHFQCYNEVKVIILSQQGGIYMKSCSKCNCKIDLLTRLKTLGSECVRIKCESCGTVYEVESKGIVKIINALSFFMIFYLIYYFLNFMEIDLKIRIGIVFFLAVVFYIFWNAIMSYFLEYKVIFEGYNINRKSTNKEESITTINRTSQAKQILNDILTKNGFDEKNIQLDILIDSFEEFLNKKFNCYEDQIIYTIRPNDLVYRDLSCCTLIRQFVTRNVSGELNLERIYIQVYYNSKDLIDKLYNLHFNYTSDKFDEFLANVRDENSYWEVLKLYEPVKYEITEEKLF